MGHIISISKDFNSDSLNKDMHYSHIYFGDKNKKLSEFDFCQKKALYIKIE